jgi:hypothetical protein
MILNKMQWNMFRPKLQKLFESSFGRPISEEYLNWRYRDNLSENFYFAIQEHEEILLASYSAFPLILLSNGREYSSALSMTTMTHPDARGRGLFPSLANELYSAASPKTFGSIIGFPNSNSHVTFCNRLSWLDIYEIPTMSLDIANALGQNVTANAIIRDDAFRYEYSNAANQEFIRLKKDRQYLTWRYSLNPVNKYENYVIQKDGAVLSYIVTKEFIGGMDLVDINCVNESHLRSLIAYILELSGNRGLNRLSCWMPLHNPMHQVLERIGFYNQGGVTYFGGRELIAGGVPSKFFEYKSWHIQMGDSDVY